LGLSGLEDESKQPKKIRTNHWLPHIVQKILSLRRSNPLYGKNKIAVLLKRDHRLTISISTVGRIIKHLINCDQIKPACFYYKKKRARPRLFNKHAKRWTRDMKAQHPGELFQIDHMSVSLASDYHIKHFQGICPVTKIAVKQAYSRATSNTAKQFLEYAQERLPFKLKSIQVDGGSEFMKEFEQACADLNLPLYVLPPKSPEYNGVVERTNGSSRYEFYAFYDGNFNLFSIRKALQKYVKKYNTYRPHQALQYLTPQQYFYKISGA
jgi:transposase InsO family protein